MSRLRLVATVVAVWTSLGHAQCEPSWSEEFGSMGDLSGPAHALAWFDDGSGPALYVGGAFVSAGGTAAHRIARWDGAEWSAVGSGLSGPVHAMIVHDDGVAGPALFVAGEFAAAGGAPAPSGVARWDGSGWTALPGETDGVILELEVFDDGAGEALYVGGDFTRAGGAEAANIARWDGSSWSALDGGVSGIVRAMEPFDDGSGPALYVGGDFEAAGGIAADGLARWTGAWEEAPAPTPARSGLGVQALAALDDGSGRALYAGGWFEGSAGEVGLARLRGGVWETLAGSPTYVVALGPVEIEGRLVMGAASRSLAGAWVDAEWRELGLVRASEWLGRVDAMLHVAGPAGPATYLAGAIISVGPVAVRGIARWDGAAWSAMSAPGGLGGRASDNPRVLALHGEGARTFVGGSFVTAGPVAAPAVAVHDGAGWAALGAGIEQPSGNFSVWALRAASLPGLEGVVAGGSAPWATSTEALIWDGLSWAPVGRPFTLDIPDATAFVADFATFDDGSGASLYATGYFNNPGSGIARWSGDQWQPVGGGLRGPLGVGHGFSLAVHDDGSGPALYVGGFFFSAGPIPAQNIARWSASGWTAVGDGLPFLVEALLEFDDGSGTALIAAGGDSSGGEVWRWDGAAWSRMGGVFNGAVSALAIFDDGSGEALYAGGAFLQHDGRLIRGLARWEGGEWVEVAGGVGGSVHALAPVAYRGARALMVGGRFVGVGGGIPSHNIARLVGCARACRPDCDGDGEVTFADFLCFQDEFVAMTPYADCDDSGRHDVFDFLCFQDAFAAGCP